MNEKKYERLLFAVIQTQDAETAENTLKQLGVSVQRLSSFGAFLGRRNTTLLIPVPIGKKQAVVGALNDSCRQRIEYIAVPLESAPLPLPTPTPISIGGATIFELEVEHYEEM
jgi:uncharacterized protein YaaQ